MCKTTVSKG